MPVVDLKGRRIGRVKDAAMVPWSIPPASTACWSAAPMPGSPSASIRSAPSRSTKASNSARNILVPYHDDEYMLRIARDLLDQQIIDVTGRKVVRVNDVTMRDPAAMARATP